MGANAALFHPVDHRASGYLPPVNASLETQLLLEQCFSEGSDFTEEVFCPAE